MCRNVTGIDISTVVIDQLLERNRAENRPELVYITMDATRMTFPDETFDCIIDKSTLDALCSSRSDLAIAMVHEASICISSFLYLTKSLLQCERVLKPGGYYVCISFGEPSNRIPM